MYALRKSNHLIAIVIAISLMLTSIFLMPITAYADSSGTGWSYDSTTKTLTIISNAATENYDEYEGIITDVSCLVLGSEVTEIIGNIIYYNMTLTAITVDADNPKYASAEGVLFNKNKTTLEAYPPAKPESSYSVPSGVTTVNNIGSANLNSVTISNSVSKIGYSNSYISTFNSCTNLLNIIVDENNSTFASDDGVLYNKNKTKLLRYPTGKYGTYSIPSDVTSIAQNAFSSCTNLTSITIPSSVTSIGDDAFSHCTNLTSITIPGSVTSIGTSDGYISTFYDCASLEEIIVESSNIKYASESGVLFNKGKTKLLLCPKGKSGAYVIPSSVTNIATPGYDEGLDAGFSYCKKLTSITIPNGVKSLGDGVFMGCSSLTTISIPSSVENIALNSDDGSEPAFTGCQSLTNITVDNGNLSYASIDGVLFNKSKTKLLLYPRGKTAYTYSIPSGVTTIRYGAIGCDNLVNISIPSSVSLIEVGEYDGYGDNLSGISFGIGLNLKDISVAGNNTKYTSENGVLFNKVKTVLITYPRAKEGAYSIPSSVKTIGKYSFSNCSNLTNLTIPSGVIEIGYYSFYGSTNLTIYCIQGSVAHQYAITHSIPFELIANTSCIVAFDANGGKVNPANTAVYSGATIGTLPTPTRTGYTFDGWYTAKSGGVKIAATTVINANVTYYAHWIKNADTKPQYKAKDPKSPVPPVAITKAPKVKAKKKAVTVAIPKTAGATGYIIKYRSGKGKWKSVTVKGNNPKLKTIKTLKKGKKYTFKIQSIKKVGNKTYKAKWSKTRTVKVK